jgi:hypothetical protein
MENERNIKLWLSNDESLYRAMVKYARIADDPNYRELIMILGYEDSRTPDGTDWIDDSLDYVELDEFVADHKND